MYKFAVGEEVRVLEKETIIQTLDSEHKFENCLVMDQMWKYCGKNYKVLKIVKNFINNRNKKLIMSRSPIYILENLLCDGNDLFEHICDKSCYLLWHQNWLTKI